MKIRVLSAIFVVAGLITGSAILENDTLTANNSGAPSGKTGSPGDNSNCSSCHSGGAVNAFGLLSSTIPPTGYEPGLTYTITATCTDPAINRFGFQISPQKPSGTKHGTLIVTDAARTKLVGSGKYITHTSSGTSGAGSVTWSFNWIAPAAGTGDVTFYGAFNFSNHNNATSGDHIKLADMLVSENTGTAVSLIGWEESIRVWPNPVTEVLNFSVNEQAPANSAAIYDLSGGLVRSFQSLPAAENFEINVADLPAGSYFLYFASEKGSYTRRFVKL